MFGFWKTKSRYIILHSHLFKNAGSTIDFSLRRTFGSGFAVDIEEPALMKPDENLEAYVQKHRKLRAVSMHLFRPPIPTVEGVMWMFLMMFRHPVNRLRSVYLYERKQGGETPGSKYAREHSFSDYVRWRLRPDVGPTIRNFHCYKLLERKDVGKAVSDEELQSLITQLEQLPLIGVVERYDESMVAFEEALRPVFPNIDFSYVKQNVSATAASALDLELSSLRTDLGKDLVDEYLKENAQDIALYNAANRLLTARIRQIGNFEGMVEHLVERSRALAAQL